MSQIVLMDTEQKALLMKASWEFYGEKFRGHIRDIVNTAPRYNPEEELRYLISDRDVNDEAWPAFQRLRDSRLYARPYKPEDPEKLEDGVEYVLISASVFEMILAALKRLLEMLLGIPGAGNDGSPPVAKPVRKPRPAGDQLLLEYR